MNCPAMTAQEREEQPPTQVPPFHVSDNRQYNKERERERESMIEKQEKEKGKLEESPTEDKILVFSLSLLLSLPVSRSLDSPVVHP